MENMRSFSYMSSELGIYYLSLLLNCVDLFTACVAAISTQDSSHLVQGKKNY